MDGSADGSPSRASGPPDFDQEVVLPFRWSSALAAALAAACLTATPALAGASRGPSGYAYAGVQAHDNGYGISAVLTALATPVVESGHVAGWVGVGGPGQGPGGSDQWIQVGLNSLPGTGNTLYYEVMRPDTGPRYYEVARDLESGRPVRVAVLETSSRRGAWRIWVNGRAVTGPIPLAGSHGALTPMAMTESWNGGRSTSNRYAYRFERVALATAPGGSWKVLRDATVLQDSGYKIVRRTQGSFDASTRRAPPAVRVATPPPAVRASAPVPAAARSAAARTAARKRATARTKLATNATKTAPSNTVLQGGSRALSSTRVETAAVQVITARPVAVSAPLRKGFLPAPALERLLALVSRPEPVAAAPAPAVAPVAELALAAEPVEVAPAEEPGVDPEPGIGGDTVERGLPIGLGGTLLQASELEPALA